MGLKDGENLNVTCPCCQAKLVIDPVFGAVLRRHEFELAVHAKAA